MKTKHTFRRLVIFLVIAAMLIGVMPVSAETEEKEPFKGSISLKLSTRGFGTADSMLGFLDFSLGIDARKKVADLRMSLLSKGVDLIVAWDSGMPRFTVPAAGTEVYALGKELLTELESTVMNAMKSSAGQKDATANVDWLQKIGELVLSTFMNPQNMTVEPRSYTYEMLSGTANGQAVVIKLSKEQWKIFLTKLTELLGENSELLASLAKKYNTLPADLSDQLALSEEDKEKLAESAKDVDVTVFLADNKLISVSAGTPTARILYESKGDIKNGGRTDALSLTKEGQTMKLLENTVTSFNSNVVGNLKIADLVTVEYTYIKSANGGATFTVTFTYQDKGISLQALYTPGEVNIAVPGNPDQEINSTSELTTVLSDVLEKAVSSLTSF